MKGGQEKERRRREVKGEEMKIKGEERRKEEKRRKIKGEEEERKGEGRKK